MPYACIRRSRYGYIVNNKNTLKHPDVVILDKDNNLNIFFLCAVRLHITGCNGQTCKFEQQFDVSSKQIEFTISANSNKPKCDDQRSQVYTENKQTEEDKV